MYKLMLLFFILSAMFFGSRNLVLANEKHKTEEHVSAPVHQTEAHSPEAGSHGQVSGGHVVVAEHAEESQGISVLYFVYWAVLILLLVLAGRYVGSIQVGPYDSSENVSAVHLAEEARQSNSNLPKILIALAVGLYLLDQFPAIKHYHEPIFIGFTRFLLKFSAGILMTISAFTWMHAHHEEH